MQARYMINAHDVFSVGMTHRIMVGAEPRLKGSSMAEKQRYLEENCDHLRQAAVCGVSNSPDLVGVLVTEAVDPDADVGIIYFVKEGYWAMCGSGTFALGTFLVESGIVKPVEPQTEITLELITGLMKLTVEVENGKVVKTSTTTEPVFHVKEVQLDLPNMGKTKINVAYCLNYFESQVDAGSLGVDVSHKNRTQLIDLGTNVREIINEKMTLLHPTNPDIDRAVQTLIYSQVSDDNPNHFRGVAIYGENGFDLTPSGTSTCAFMATRYAHGMMTVGDEIRMESVSGAVIEGKILVETKVGEELAIIPQIRGDASVAQSTTIFV